MMPAAINRSGFMDVSFWWGSAGSVFGIGGGSKMDHAVVHVHSVSFQGLDARRCCDCACPNVEHALMKRALNLVADEISVNQRCSPMRAFVLSRIHAAFDVKKRDCVTVEIASARLAFRQIG
jgi:hypothetical protein